MLFARIVLHFRIITQSCQRGATRIKSRNKKESVCWEFQHYNTFGTVLRSVFERKKIRKAAFLRLSGRKQGCWRKKKRNKKKKRKLLTDDERNIIKTSFLEIKGYVVYIEILFWQLLITHYAKLQKGGCKRLRTKATRENKRRTTLGSPLLRLYRLVFAAFSGIAAWFLWFFVRYVNSMSCNQFIPFSYFWLKRLHLLSCLT